MPVCIGRFQVQRMLGRGGMGVVFLARDPELGRHVALKLLSTRATSGGTELSGSARDRLLREARAMAHLNHPNVLTVHEIGEVGDGIFIAMEYAAGGTLRAWCAAAPRSWQATVDLFLAAGRGLCAAHAAGLVHRDFKPANVLLTADGRVRVADFGLVAGVAERPQAPDHAPQVTGDGFQTHDGAILGTPGYMAPEQLRGERATPATDQFAFCVSLWEALAGERPFPGDDFPSLTASVLAGKLRQPPRRRAPAAVWSALARGLRTEPSQRWPSLEQLLESLIATSKRRARRRAAMLVLGGGAAIAAMSLTLTRSPHRASTGEAVAASLLPRFDHRPLSSSGRARGVAISADGQQIAYGEDGDIVIRDVATGRELRHPVGKEYGLLRFGLKFSPRGDELAVALVQKDAVTRKILVLSTRSTDARTLDVPEVGTLSWSPDGCCLASLKFDRRPRIAVFDTRTSEERRTIELPAELATPGSLLVDWSPDGSFLLRRTEGKHAGIWSVDADGTNPVLLLAQGAQRVSDARESASGTWTYVSRGSEGFTELLRLPSTGQPSEATIADRELFSGLEGGQFSISADEARVAYVRSAKTQHLWRVDLQAPEAPPLQVTSGTASKGPGSISPDGRWLALPMGSGVASEIFVAPSAGGPPRQITHLGARATTPVWSPDGSEIAFHADRGGEHRLWVVRVDSGEARPLVSGVAPGRGIDWAPARRIIYQREGDRRFGIVDPSTGEDRAVLGNLIGADFAGEPRWSPDGRTVLFAWLVERRWGLYRAEVDGDPTPVRIADADAEPIGWTADGDSVMVLLDGAVEVIPARGGGAARTSPLPARLAGCEGVRVSADGSFLVCFQTEGDSDVWLAERRP